MEDYNSGTSFSTYLAIILPVVSSVVTWWVARKKRNNDFLAELQDSIDLLSQKYNDALQQLVEVRGQNSELLISQKEMKVQMDELKRENSVLKKTIDDLNERLSNVKTITRRA
ncbi:MAG: hypothetical protein WCS17_12815 [Prevotella sp.]